MAHEASFPTALTPIAVDPSHPFPFIANAGHYGWRRAPARARRHHHARADPDPQPARAFCRLPVEEGVEREGTRPIRFIRIEFDDRHAPGAAVPGLPVTCSHGAFRVLRDSDIEVQEEAEILVASYEQVSSAAAAKRHPPRDRRPDAPPERFVVQELDIRDDAVFIKEGLLGLADMPSHRLRAADLASSRSTSAFPSASASWATALPPSARRHRRPPPLRVRMWWCRCCARPWPTPTSWPSSGRSRLQRQPDRARAQGRGRPRRSPPWSSSRRASTRRPTSVGATWKWRARGLRLHPAQDPRQARPDRAPRGQRAWPPIESDWTFYPVMAKVYTIPSWGAT